MTGRKKSKDEKYLTKVVVRRLPPNFTSETFREQVFPIPDHNYFYFVGCDKVNPYAFSRAYINFVNYEDAIVFKEKYDMYVFLGPKGMEYPAVVEYAPFQKVPKDRWSHKRDAKCGTIYDNEYYLQFLKELKASKCETFARTEYDLNLDSQSAGEENMTPLLKYVTAKRTEQARNRKNEHKQRYFENAIVFVNSSVKKGCNRRSYLKKYFQ